MKAALWIGGGFFAGLVLSKAAAGCGCAGASQESTATGGVYSGEFGEFFARAEQMFSDAIPEQLIADWPVSAPESASLSSTGGGGYVNPDIYADPSCTACRVEVN